MGYRDDFYVAENIIGYTGDVGSNPSVYFRSGSEWGRITQDHDKKTNIGRAFVRDTMPYTIVNETRVIKGEQKEVSVEYVNGEEHHVSRNKFFPVSDENRDALAFAIKNEKLRGYGIAGGVIYALYRLLSLLNFISGGY